MAARDLAARQASGRLGDAIRRKQPEEVIEKYRQELAAITAERLENQAKAIRERYNVTKTR